MSKSEYQLVRKMTLSNENEPWLPEQIGIGTRLSGGLGSLVRAYTKALTQVLAMSNRIYAKEGRNLTTQEVRWLWYGAIFTGQHFDPNVAGLGRPDLDYMLEEDIEAVEEAHIVLTVRAYRPDADDRTEHATRLPMTEIEKLTKECGTLTFDMDLTPAGAIKVEGTGILSVDYLRIIQEQLDKRGF